MADKAEKKADAAPAAAAAPEKGAAPAKKGGIGALLGKTPVMLGGVMILEAVVLFAGFKFLGSGPNHAAGADVVTSESAEGSGKKEDGGKDGKAGPKRKTVEIAVVDFKAPNKTSGRMYMYDVSIFAVSKADFEQQVKDGIKAQERLIQDRIRTIIAQNDPEKLGGGSEPGLETLRRQIKHQLDEIIGEGMIDEVLVPKCIPFRTDF